MLTKLLADRLEAVEELASADWPRHTRPSGPEILHPAQRAAVQEDSGLRGFYKKEIHLTANSKVRVQHW